MRLGENTTLSFPIELTNAQLRQHVFLQGAAEDGRKSLQVSLAIDAISRGAALVYFDTSPSAEVCERLITAAEAVNRQKDVIVLDLVSRKPTDPSIRLDPLERSSPSEATQFLIGLVTQAHTRAHPAWRNAAEDLLQRVFSARMYLRQVGEPLTISRVYDALSPAGIAALAHDDRLPRAYQEAVYHVGNIVGLWSSDSSESAVKVLDELVLPILEKVACLPRGFGASTDKRISFGDVLRNKEVFIIRLPEGCPGSATGVLLSSYLRRDLLEESWRTRPPRGAQAPALDGEPQMYVFFDGEESYVNDAIFGLGSLPEWLSLSCFHSVDDGKAFHRRERSPALASSCGVKVLFRPRSPEVDWPIYQVDLNGDVLRPENIDAMRRQLPAETALFIEKDWATIMKLRCDRPSLQAGASKSRQKWK